MSKPSLPPSPAQPQRGFTLIEILIVLVVATVLVAIAVPSAQSALRSARRADAIDAMTRVQQAQERWRSNNRDYAPSTLLTTAWPNGLGQSATSVGGYYTISTAVTNAAAGAATASTVSYSVTATAVAGRSQNSDRSGSQVCNVLTMTITSGNPVYTPDACWRR